LSDEAFVQIWCAVSAAAWLLLGTRIAAKRRDGFHPGTIFCLLFAWTYPLKLIGTTLGFAVLNSSQLGSEWQLTALALANVAAAMFVLPVILGAKAHHASEGGAPDTVDRASGLGWLVAAMTLIVASYGFYALRNIFAFDVLAEISEQRGETRTYSAMSALVRDAGTFCLITHFAVVMRRWASMRTGARLMYGLVWCGAAYAMLAVSASKYQGLLPFAAGVLVANLLRVERTGRGFALSRTVAWSLVAVVGISTAGYLRGFGAIQSTEGFVLTSVTQMSHAFDAPDNLSFILSRIDNPWTGDLAFAPTLQYLVLSSIPRAAWPEKPLVLGNQYIMQHYLSERFTDEAGEAISPSMAGEMLLSGGVWFVIVWSLVLGIGCMTVYRLAHRHLDSPVAVAAYVWMSLNIFNLLRSGTGVVAPLLTFTGVSVTVLVVARLAATVVRGAVAPRADGLAASGAGLGGGS
jgi:hypothetical protein